MAFGLYCKRCGYQESEHHSDYWPNACKSYVSPDRRAEKAMWKADQEEEARYENRLRRGPAYEH